MLLVIATGKALKLFNTELIPPLGENLSLPQGAERSPIMISIRMMRRVFWFIAVYIGLAVGIASHSELMMMGVGKYPIVFVAKWTGILFGSIFCEALLFVSARLFADWYFFARLKKYQKERAKRRR